MIIIYDFTWNNPANRDVRKVTSSNIQRLFPSATIQTCRLTLAPPIARRIPAWLYPFVNIPVLKTHRLWWFRKVPSCSTRPELAQTQDDLSPQNETERD